MKIVGLDKYLAALKALEKKVRNKAVKAALKAGLKPLVAAAKANAPQDTGTLKKAIGDKSKSYRGGLSQIVMVGARVGQARQITRVFTKRGQQKFKLARVKGKAQKGTEVRDAAKYLHLVESGRKAVFPKKGSYLAFRDKQGKMLAAKKARASRPRGFMRKAWKQSKQAAYQAMLSTLKSELESAMQEVATK